MQASYVSHNALFRDFQRHTQLMSTCFMSLDEEFRPKVAYCQHALLLMLLVIVAIKFICL